eukprot:6072490-Pyramimonas_sp.AAC.1
MGCCGDCRLSRFMLIFVWDLSAVFIFHVPGHLLVTTRVSRVLSVRSLWPVRPAPSCCCPVTACRSLS